MYSCSLTLLLYIVKSLYIIYSRFSISHTYYTCKTTSCRCSSTCYYILFISKSRISEMNMRIHKTRRNHQSSCIYNCNIICLINTNIMSNFFNNIIFNNNIHNRISSCYRINYTSILYKHSW